MRIDQLDVALRARSQWEAMELGTALVRRHAAAIWKPWVLLTLPVFALLNLLGWWLDNFWVSSFILWWLKPAFERIPLYVISRGAFGAEPTTGQTLRAQWNWGWRGVGAYLGWRRLSPARSLLMPVDLLEGGDASQRRGRRHALGGAAYGHAALLTWVCWHFEAMLQFAGVALFFMFVPVELLSESLRATWELIGQDTPAWAWIGFNLLAWLAMTLISPFYSGAGFGLYLNRRTQLEAWDVEIAFRRLRERLAGLAPVLVVLLAVFALPSLQALAQDSTDTHSVSSHGNHKDATEAGTESSPAAAAATTPQQLFDAAPADTAGFRQAAARAYEDPQLGAKRSVTRWVKKASDKKPDTDDDNDERDLGPILGAIAKFAALISESILWILLAVLLVVLALTARWWLPWFRGDGRRSRDVQTPALQEALQLPEVLPPDILGSARRLWREGKPRHALALLYRASVEVLVERGNTVLPPGATEAQCLRASRKMPQDADRNLFARMVRIWQYAAYAGRLPSDEEFDALIKELHQQYGWAGMNAAMRNTLVVVLLLLATLVAFWFVRNYEKVSEEVTLPAYGEPTYNALYALREALIRDGSKAATRRQLDLPAMQLQPGDTVLMLDDPRLLTPTQVESLLDWLQFGGHLVLQAPDADGDLDGDEQGLLERLGVVPSDVPARCQIWQVPGQESHNEFCRGNRFTLAGKARAERRWADADDDGTLAYARLRYGLGRVDVLGDMDFLLNGSGERDTGLRDIPHRDLARLVLAPNYGKGTTHLIYAMELPSLWKTLFQRGWPVWVPLLLALLAWLWMRCQRFGALLPSPREDRRSLLEHVRASGEHLHRYRKSPLLYDAVRQAFLTRLRRRAPVAAALTGDAQAQAIADHLQWPIGRVQTALQIPPSQDDIALRDRIRLLIQMRNQL